MELKIRHETAVGKPSPLEVPGRVFWITGRSAAGKTSIGRALSADLRSCGRTVIFLDGDTLRAAVSNDLGYSIENRRAAAMRPVCEANFYVRWMPGGRGRFSQRESIATIRTPLQFPPWNLQTVQFAVNDGIKGRHRGGGKGVPQTCRSVGRRLPQVHLAQKPKCHGGSRRKNPAVLTKTTLPNAHYDAHRSMD